MRYRVAILAVLVFALVDFAQGLGVLGAAPTLAALASAIAPGTPVLIH